METRLLRYFLTVAHEENITRAAEVLHITQPTLSRQLVQLEEETGVTLFIRGKRKITLTPEGMLLRRRAEEILSLVNKTEKELLQQDALLEGTISIGCGELNSVNLLAQIIKDFKALYPKVKFNLHTGNSDRLKEQLEQGLIDIALLLEPVSIEKYDFLRLPVKERWGVIMPTGCALAAKKSITARDLTGLPLITDRRATINNELNNWIGRELRNLNIVFTTDLAANAILMVTSGLAYQLTLENPVPALDGTRVTFRPLEPELSFGTLLAWKRYAPGSPAAEKFISHAKCFLSMNQSQR